MARDLNNATYEELLESYSDCFKCLYNFRPRGSVSREELISFWESYDENIAYLNALEKAKDEQALHVWESTINQIQNHYNISKADAIRWHMQAEGFDNNKSDWEQYLWEQGIESLDHQFKLMKKFEEMFDA